MKIYTPNNYSQPKHIADVPSAWRGLESILEDILVRFKINRGKALEFGVEYGYSLSVISNYFKQVHGVDTFEGDENTENGPVDINKVQSQLPEHVKLFKMDFRKFVVAHRLNAPYNLIHVDIAHNYQDTYDAGEWAVKNADIVLFHDTESFDEVKRAVSDLADKYHLNFYNYPKCYGLGILCRKSL